jgi:ribose 5-phosphate isomerase A
VSREEEKRLVGEAAAELVEAGMRVGLGTGSTVSYLLRALARRQLKADYVASSPRTEHEARSLGLSIESFENFDDLDLAIDGADQISSDGWLIKGGGGAHTREKIIAAASQRFVVIVDSSKLVDVLHVPVPVELQRFGIETTLRQIAPTELRGDETSPDGGLLADYLGPIGVYQELAQWLCATPGVVEHGLFPPSLVTDILSGTGKTVVRTTTGGTR